MAGSGSFPVPPLFSRTFSQPSIPCFASDPLSSRQLRPPTSSNIAKHCVPNRMTAPQHTETQGKYHETHTTRHGRWCIPMLNVSNWRHYTFGARIWMSSSRISAICSRSRFTISCSVCSSLSDLATTSTYFEYARMDDSSQDRAGHDGAGERSRSR